LGNPNPITNSFMSSDFNEHRPHYRFNIFVNLTDASFFGAAMGFASFITVIPLFVSNLTNSPILIGLIPAIHAVGWQLPQLFTAHRVSRSSRLLPIAMFFTINERLPFLGLCLLAWFLPNIGPKICLIFTFIMLVWQGLGAGFTATAWQSLIAKIIPNDRRGTFFGFQAAFANLLMSGSAILAGILLETVAYPLNFTLCFLFAFLALILSYISLGLVREEDTPTQIPPSQEKGLIQGSREILRRDANFRWFLVIRMLSQLAVMSFGFYTVYAVKSLGMSEITAGVMTGVLTFGQVIANPLMGWIGDRWNHPSVMKIGALAAALSSFLAWLAPGISWFYYVFILAGIANVSIWTIGMALSLEFGNESERPAYIGLSNTLVAPATILAPILGGGLAARFGYPSAFLIAAISGVITTLVLHFMLRDPRAMRLEKENSQLAVDYDAEVT
jgi:MFS family permease